MMEKFQETSPVQHGPTVYMRHPQSVQNTFETSVLDAGNPELTDLGRNQAVEMARFIAGQELSVVVCSPALRTVQAAEIIASSLGGEIEVFEEPGLRELDWGRWAGMERDKVFTREEEDRAAREGLDYRANPEAETMREVHTRVQAVVQKYGEAAYLTSNFTIKSAVATELDWPRIKARSLKIRNGEAVAFNPLSEDAPLQTLFLPENR